MVEYMAIVNLTPDSFHEPSRMWDAGGVPVERCVRRVRDLLAAGASIVDLGAVSTRPGAAAVPVEEEWRRLEPVLHALSPLLPSSGCNSARVSAPAGLGMRISIDTTSSEIVRRAYDVIGPFIVNDISAGEDDPYMLPLAARLGLTYVAMHKRGTPSTMDGLCWYSGGVVEELLSYFGAFSRRASALGLSDWILDPGLGFAKTPAQCWEILLQLERLQVFGRPVLVGAADKRFTRSVPEDLQRQYPGASGEEIANCLSVRGGASILRVHRVPGL